MLRRLRQSHTGTTALTEDALVGDHVILGPAAQILCRDFLKLLLGVHRCRMCCARHRVGRLTAAGYTGKGKVPRRVTPDDIALFPRHAQDLRAGPMYVNHGLRPEVADSGLEGDPSIRLDNEKPVESDRAANETAK